MVDATRESAHRNRETQNGAPCGDLREGNRDFKVLCGLQPGWQMKERAQFSRNPEKA